MLKPGTYPNDRNSHPLFAVPHESRLCETDSTNDASDEDFTKQIVDPHVFPPRAEHPFAVYDVSLMADDTLERLHPLERMPKDTQLSDGWINMNYDEGHFSKKEEAEMPLEHFDEIRREHDEIARAAIDRLRSQKDQKGDTEGPSGVEAICAYSRCYDLQPRFRWEECEVLEFDRCV